MFFFQANLAVFFSVRHCCKICLTDVSAHHQKLSNYYFICDDPCYRGFNPNGIAICLFNTAPTGMYSYYIEDNYDKNNIEDWSRKITFIRRRMIPCFVFMNFHQSQFDILIIEKLIFFVSVSKKKPI